MSQTTITLLFLAFAVISFILEKIPLGLTASICAIGLTLTGVLILALAYIIMTQLDRRYTLPEADLPTGGAVMQSGTALYLLYAVIFAWLFLKASGGSGAFIYFQF